MLTLALNTSECLVGLTRLQTEVRSGKLRIQEVVELEERSSDAGMAEFQSWLERVQELQRTAAVCWKEPASSAAQLEQSKELVRSLTTGTVGPFQLVNVAYLLTMGLIGLYLSSRRIDKLLLK